MKLSELIKIHIVKRLPAILATVFIAALFTLYYVGILDVSFIKRPSAWKDNLQLFTEFLYPETAKKLEIEPETEDLIEKPVEDTHETKPNRPTKPTLADPDKLYVPLTFSNVSDLMNEGYYRTDKDFDDTCKFGILQTEYELPDDLSYTWKKFDKEKITKFEDGTESKVDIIHTSEERMALEMYMGYIIYDDMGDLYLIGPDGAVLCRYSDTEFIPAYTRDKEGRPLFYKNTTYSEKYPTVLGEENEDGEREWKETKTLNIKDKIYYYLASDGRSFIKSDYNDATDNRGLYFDYTASYGRTTSPLKRYYLNTTKFFTDLKGETRVLDAMSWTFSKEKIKLDELEFDKDGVLVTEDEQEEPKTKKDLFPYTMAYNYSERYATVFADIDWSYEHDVENEEKVIEKKTFDVTTNELRIIDENGKFMFESRKNYFSELNWTAHEIYSKPLLSGVDSLGSYYFDHGLMRMRIKSFDCYYYAEFDTVKIVTDDDVLIKPNGEIFSIPTGYKLKAYSDGVLLLEKGEKFGYLNYLGNWIRDPDMTDAEPFFEGVAVCTNDEDKYGVIDTSGNTLIPFEYDYISNISSGTLVAFSEYEGWTIFQKLTK